MAQLQTTPLRTEPISQGSPYLDWEPRSSSLAPNRVGLCLLPHGSWQPQTSPRMGILSPCHLPPRTQHPPPPQPLLPHLPNLICLPVGGHSLLRSPDVGPQTPGAAGGEGAAVQSFCTAVPLWVLGGGAPGFPLGLWGGQSMPPSSAPGRGAGARWAGGWPGQRANLSASRGTRPVAARRRGSPGLCAPAPAAQLLRMTSSHLPLQACTSPRAGGGVGGLRQEAPGAAGRCSLRTA